jgi:hypothetical protein
MNKRKWINEITNSDEMKREKEGILWQEERVRQ